MEQLLRAMFGSTLLLVYLVCVAFLLWRFVRLTRDVADIKRLLEQHLRRPPAASGDLS